MKTAILGLPQSGRTTLFRYLGNYSLSEERLPERSVLKIPDKRLDRLAAEFESVRVVSAEIVLADGTGDIEHDGRTLEALRPVEVLIWQIRGFDDGFGNPSPADDYAILREIIFEMDIACLTTRKTNIEIRIKKGAQADERKDLTREAVTIEMMIEALSAGKAIRNLELDKMGVQVANNYSLLSAKPALIHVSCDEDRYADHAKIITELTALDGADQSKIAYHASMPQFELELCELDDEDAASFREDAGLCAEPRMEIISAIFIASRMHVFITAGQKESRTWLLEKGSNAVEAADVIHSDFAKGFIRAEILGWDDYIEAGTYKKAKAAGKLRLEGKEYIIKDGDNILFRFNV